MGEFTAVGKYDTAVAAPNIFLLDLDFFEAFGTDAVSVLNTAGSDKGNIQGKLLQGLDGLFLSLIHIYRNLRTGILPGGRYQRFLTKL